MANAIAHLKSEVRSSSLISLFDEVDGSEEEKKRQENLRSMCDPSVDQDAGHFLLNSSTGDKDYFYWFFESRGDPENDPFVLWLTGTFNVNTDIDMDIEIAVDANGDIDIYS